MARLILEPSPMELGLHRKQYEALVADLEAEGHEVELVLPVEQRGGVPLELLYDLTVRVGALAGAAVAVDELVGRICQASAGPKARQGRASPAARRDLPRARKGSRVGLSG